MYKLLYFVTSTIANFINMDYNTISDLAKMSYNVYYDINNKNWLNTTLNNVIDVSISNDTVRAYLFTNNEKTNTVTEELILYMFLGVFVIFVVDSFAKAGKYTR